MQEGKEFTKNKGPSEGKKIILVGNANVGKSVIFSLLTGRYATVSNYPGTTVEISRGNTRIGNRNFEVIDILDIDKNNKSDIAPVEISIEADIQVMGRF